MKGSESTHSTGSRGFASVNGKRLRPMPRRRRPVAVWLPPHSFSGDENLGSEDEGPERQLIPLAVTGAAADLGLRTNASHTDALGVIRRATKAARVRRIVEISGVRGRETRPPTLTSWIERPILSWKRQIQLRARSRPTVMLVKMGPVNLVEGDEGIPGRACRDLLLRYVEPNLPLGPVDPGHRV